MSQNRPDIDTTTSAFWRGAAEGRLLGSSCAECGAIAMYPRGFCPSCWSDQVEDVELSGKATLYTDSVVRMNPMPPLADGVPYVAAVVDLEEGPRLMTRLVDDPESVSIDMQLSARFATVDDDEGMVVFGPA